MPMTDEDRRGTLDLVKNTCREAAYLNLALQRTPAAAAVSSLAKVALGG